VPGGFDGGGMGVVGGVAGVDFGVVGWTGAGYVGVIVEGVGVGA
jgi:hypothetical protein